MVSFAWCNKLVTRNNFTLFFHLSSQEQRELGFSLSFLCEEQMNKETLNDDKFNARIVLRYFTATSFRSASLLPLNAGAIIIIIIDAVTLYTIIIIDAVTLYTIIIIDAVTLNTIIINDVGYLIYDNNNY